jgi:hypothetical protein
VIDGIERTIFRRQYDADSLELGLKEIARLQEQGLLAVTPERIALTPRAHLLGTFRACGTQRGRTLRTRKEWELRPSMDVSRIASGHGAE